MVTTSTRTRCRSVTGDWHWRHCRCVHVYRNRFRSSGDCYTGHVSVGTDGCCWRSRRNGPGINGSRPSRSGWFEYRRSAGSSGFDRCSRTTRNSGHQRLTRCPGAQGVAGTNGTNGTGFNFRGTFNPSTSYASNDVVSYSPITYNVNVSFGASGSMVGTITTDGTIGVLNTSNIVSWNLRLADSATNSTTLTPSNSAFGSGNQNTGGQPNNQLHRNLDQPHDDVQQWWFLVGCGSVRAVLYDRLVQLLRPHCVWNVEHQR